MTAQKTSREEPIQGSSDRSFGMVFAVVFTIVGLFPLLKGGDPRWWGLAVAALFAVLALVAPAVLAPLNRIWTRFGLVLHTIMTPLVMGIMFFVVITPIGLLMRLFGKNPLRLGFEADKESYWIHREDPGPPPDTMKHQF